MWSSSKCIYAFGQKPSSGKIPDALEVWYLGVGKEKSGLRIQVRK